ncbi:MAG: hypothetical protein R3D88_07750 [Alphaproteobacteria bacterium]|nr:hypothetical protein [Alphaproteobacteria bacterium]
MDDKPIELKKFDLSRNEINELADGLWKIFRRGARAIENDNIYTNDKAEIAVRAAQALIALTKC